MDQQLPDNNSVLSHAKKKITAANNTVLKLEGQGKYLGLNLLID